MVQEIRTVEATILKVKGLICTEVKKSFKKKVLLNILLIIMQE